MMRRIAFAVLLGSITSVCGQQQVPSPTLKLRILNGQNGRPMQNEDVSLWYDEKWGTPILVRTDAHGEVQVPPPMSKAVRVIVQPMESVDCRAKSETPVGYSLSTIHQRGLAAENKCGSPVFRKEAGELILFVRDPKWYDGFNQ